MWLLETHARTPVDSSAIEGTSDAMEFAAISCDDWRVEGSITFIIVPAEDPDRFETMNLTERREESGGWKVFPLRSGRYLDTFLMTATDADFGVSPSDKYSVDATRMQLHTNLITEPGALEILPDLEALVERKTEETARSLVKHGGGTADVDRVVAALRSGAWPENGDPAEEAAAFAFQLLDHARRAKKKLMGVCWEYRGDVTV